MKALIEKIDELMRGYRDHPQTIIFDDLRELRSLVWAEQERIIEALKEAEGYLDEGEATWHDGAILRENAIKIVKGE